MLEIYRIIFVEGAKYQKAQYFTKVRNRPEKRSTKQTSRKVQCPDVLKVSKSLIFPLSVAMSSCSTNLPTLVFAMFICCFFMCVLCLCLFSTFEWQASYKSLTGLVLAPVVYTLHVCFALFLAKSSISVYFSSTFFKKILFYILRYTKRKEYQGKYSLLYYSALYKKKKVSNV